MRRTRFSPQAKILAEGRLCRPEHFDPEGRSGPSAREAQKERRAISVSFFLAKHYNLDISNFRFAILRSCPTALLGRAAFAAYERFAGGKTSAEGWLCHPEHLNHRRAERALGPRSPKRKTRYKRVFLFGESLQSRYFKFWTEHLKFCPTALLGRGAFATFEGFAVGKTLDADELHFRRALKHRGGCPLGRGTPKKM